MAPPELRGEIKALRLDIQNLPDRIAAALTKETDRALGKLAILGLGVYLLIKVIDWLRGLLF